MKNSFLNWEMPLHQLIESLTKLLFPLNADSKNHVLDFHLYLLDFFDDKITTSNNGKKNLEVVSPWKFGLLGYCLIINIQEKLRIFNNTRLNPWVFSEEDYIFFQQYIEYLMKDIYGEEVEKNFIDIIPSNIFQVMQQFNDINFQKEIINFLIETPTQNIVNMFMDKEPMNSHLYFSTFLRKGR